MNPFRRLALKCLAALFGVATLSEISERARAQEKVSKSEAKYQDRPHGQQRCEICVNFEAPASCRFVAGQINPRGWCQFFAAQENAR